MKSVCMKIGAAVFAALFLPNTVPITRAAHEAMRISQFTAKPQVVSHRGRITFTAEVQGIRLSVKHMGKRPVAGEGHLQYYADRIPSDAWSKRDRRHTFLFSVGTPVAIFGVNSSLVNLSPGVHHILVALARNNDVLYHAPFATVKITIR